MLFKRKKNKTIKVIDFSKYKIKFNVKAMMMFEELKKKSFFECDDQYDILYLMYASLVCNNDILISFDAFIEMIKDGRVLNWLTNEYRAIERFNSQFKSEIDENDEEGKDEEELNVPKISEIAAVLIVQHGIDPNYVMNEMSLWEMKNYFWAYDMKNQQMLENDRFWTYLSILPHVDGKKLKSPNKLVEFPWEVKDNKKKSEKKLENQKLFVDNMIGKKLQKKCEENIH